MDKFEQYLDLVKSSIKDLAKNTFAEFANEAISAGNSFIQETKDDIDQWTQQLKSGELNLKDFEYLIKGSKDLMDIKALTAKGIAAIKIDELKSAIVKILLSSARIFLTK